MYQVRHLISFLVVATLSAGVASAIPVFNEVKDGQFIRLDDEKDDDHSTTTQPSTFTSTSPTSTSSTSTSSTIFLSPSVSATATTLNVLPTATTNPLVTEILVSPSGLPDVAQKVHSTNGKRNTAIAAGIVGTLFFLSVVAFLAYFFRRPLRRLLSPDKYKRMGATAPAPGPASSGHINRGSSTFAPGPGPGPARPLSMAEVRKTLSGKFHMGSTQNSVPSMPSPAFVRRSSTGFNDRKTFASVVTESADSDTYASYSTPSPHLAPRVQRRMSERFPIRVSIPPQVGSPTSMISMPLPLPPVRSDVEPALSTPASVSNFPFRLPEIPASSAIFDSWPISLAGSSINGSETGGGQPKRIEKVQETPSEADSQTTVGRGRASIIGAGTGNTGYRGSQMSVPETPAPFRQHPGMRVSFGVKHGRLMSVDLDREVYEPNSDGRL